MDWIGYSQPELAHARRLGATYCTTEWGSRGGSLVAPGGRVLAVVQDSKARRVTLAKWGWAFAGRTVLHGPKTALSQRPLSESWPRRRCLVLSDRWAHGLGGPPTFVFPFGRNHGFAIAALWMPSELDGKQVVSVVLLTVPACKELRHIAPEQPAIVLLDHIDCWLDPASTLRDLKMVLASHMLYEAQRFTPDVDDWLKAEKASRETSEAGHIIWGTTI